MNFEPVQLNSNNINCIWQITCYQELGDYIVDLGYDRELASKIRRLATPDEMARLLKTFRHNWIKTQARLYLDSSLERQIVEDDFDLFTSLKLSLQPKIVRRIEKQWRLPQTGKFRKLLKNYRNRNYNRHNALNPNMCSEIQHVAKWGHNDVITKIFRSKVPLYRMEEALIISAEYGHLNTIILILSKVPPHKQAKCLDNILMTASRYNQIEIIEWAMQQGANDYNRAACSAAEHGCIALVERFINMGANDFNGIMVSAAGRGHLHIIIKMMQLGANNFDDAFEAAIIHIKGYHENVVNLLLPHITNYNAHLGEAAMFCHADIVDKMIQLGANSFRAAIDDAVIGVINSYNRPENYTILVLKLMAGIEDIDQYTREFNEADRDDVSFDHISIAYNWALTYKQIKMTHK